MPTVNAPSWRDLALTQRVPACARRILVIAPDPKGLAAGLVEQGREVHAACTADAVFAKKAGAAEGPFDAILVAEAARGHHSLSGAVAAVTPLLGPWGGLFVWGARDAVLSELAKTGFVVYAHWASENGDGSLCHLVREDYNPLEHARAAFGEGHAGFAYDLLNRIPETCLPDEETTAVVAVEKQLCLLAWDNAGEAATQFVRFYNSLFHFNAATAAAPAMPEAYHCQAEFWHRIGDDDMARRLIGIVQHINPNEAADRQRQRFTRPAPAPPEGSLPEWEPGERVPRVLMITYEWPDYGHDVLYEGLCEVLGPENVVEYPYKPSLHGERPDRLGHYPCLFDLPGERCSFEDIVEQLRQNRFDLVLFGDVDRQLPHDQVAALVAALGDTPCCLLDASDSCQDQPAVLAWLGPVSLTATFKREYLLCADFGPRTFPLPFAYPRSRIPAVLPAKRANGVFWAGHRLSGLRRLYLEHIEKNLGLAFADRVEQEAYAQALLQSRIGLNFFGFGFDTVRYWELPAHGCMLFSEKLPIRIPDDFQDGTSAVFVTGLDEMIERLRHYIEHPDEADQIARAGHEHLQRHHTGVVRARQVLGWTAQVLGRPVGG